ncbi:AAA family ATPase [Quadrisphaera sp. GCM10027208]|uniref:AAA family ATPase n=1 Tax=Quadrisphaera sp. GCM10027208 TaxID=3273423 RepID=UPI00360F01CE
MTADLRKYLSAVFGDTAGHAHLAVGTGPHVTAAGKYAHREWTETAYAWPGEADQLARAALRESAAGADVYLCPYVTHGRRRAKGAAVARRLVHADVDAAVPVDKVAELGGFAVASGSHGHGHVYVSLIEPVPAHVHTALCRALGEHLGAVDAKISDNDVLRPPGTMNYKPPTFGRGDPAPVTWLVEPSGVSWRAGDLAAALGVTLPTADAPQGPSGAVERVDPDALPRRVREALSLLSGDRSADTMRVVGACHDAGLTLAQTRGVVRLREDLTARLAERRDDDVLTCWLKATDERAQRRAGAEWAVEATGAAKGPQEATQAAHEADDGPTSLHEQWVAEELRKLRIRAEARERFDAERAAALEVPPFDAGLLAEVLARPVEPAHRVEGLIPSDAGSLIVAQRKTGKTTLELNLARCFLTGEAFLDRFTVRPLGAGARVGLLNFEVSAAQLARWAADVGVPVDRLVLVNLRGRRNPFAHDEDRERLAAYLRSLAVEALIVDPFGRAYTGKSQNDPGEVGAWLGDLDRFARGDVGATDLVLTAHAGWNGERTRGSSALEDWADSIITLTRDAEDETQRYLRAEGRDVDVDEDRLHFDPVRRWLSLTGTGSRKKSKESRAVETAMSEVVQFVAAHPGASGNEIELGVEANKGVVAKARRALVASGELIEESRRGRGGGKAYRVAPVDHSPKPPPSSPNLPPGAVRTSPTSLIEGEVLKGKFRTEPPPPPDTDLGCPDCGRPLDGDPLPGCGARQLHTGGLDL